jgi:hypothetical protein
VGLSTAMGSSETDSLGVISGLVELGLRAKYKLTAKATANIIINVYIFLI